MKILIVGSGGREHALAWKIGQSKRVAEVLSVPGNGGTRHNAKVDINDSAALADFAHNAKMDLILIGPEQPLANGVVDTFQARGLKIWGPSRSAARLETSKAYAKAFMERHNIPTGAYAAFTDFAEAHQYLQQQSQPLVIKASGLAAGKGVLLPESPAEAEEALRDMMLNRQFGQAGNEVVIETRLTGPEVSVLAFCDGHTAHLMPPAQDHKRAYNGDLGPNTGGMGAYAPAPDCTDDLLQQIAETVIQPALDGLRAEGSPYVGVLYAGMMLTADGPMTLEFNCRFGDPEAQVILPLLQSDLLDVVEHSLNGTLADARIEWAAGAAATVVLASGGYPGGYKSGKPITGLDKAANLEGVTLFQAGTRLAEDGQLVTAGGRVLNVTGTGGNLEQALQRAYQAIDLINFDNMEFRTDIGWRALV